MRRARRGGHACGILPDVDPTAARTGHHRRGRRHPLLSGPGPLRPAPAFAALALAVLLTACGIGPNDPDASETAGASAPPTGTAASGPDSSATASATGPSPTAEDAPLDGLVIAVDPGHNGGNSSDPAAINAEVPDGRGGTKACNTVGTQTDDGYPEHRFNWETAQALQEALEEAGAEVVLSRDSDDGVGPCVDERGGFADDADALVSLHANGTEDRSARGFHVVAAPAGEHADEETAEASEQLASALVDALEDEDFAPNPAYDSPVIRTDLATLNHASVPAVLLEAGEMRSADDAALLESSDGQERIADAIVDALVEVLDP